MDSLDKKGAGDTQVLDLKKIRDKLGVSGYSQPKKTDFKKGGQEQKPGEKLRSVFSRFFKKTK